MEFKPQLLKPLVTRRLVIKRLTSPRDVGAVREFRKSMDEAYGKPFNEEAYADPMAFENGRTKEFPGAVFHAYLRGHKGQAVVRLGVKLDIDRKMRVSYETHPNFRRQGFATEAQGAMVKALAKAYPDLGFAEDHDVGEVASGRVLINSGYKIKGIGQTRLFKGWGELRPKGTGRLAFPEIFKGVRYTRPSLSARRKLNPTCQP